MTKLAQSRSSRGGTMAWKLRQAAAGLSKADRRVARALLSTNLKSGLDSVAALAAASNVSGPSVLRFVAKLGFASYPDFQEALRSEFSQRTSSPRTQLERGRKTPDAKHFLETARAQLVDSLLSTFDAMHQPDFDRAAKLLSDRKRQVFVLGGRFTRIFAEYLVGRLYQIRPNVRTLGGQSVLIPKEEELPFLPASSVLVVFDLRRYQTDTIAFAREASKRGVSVILVTDTWLSPIADFATIVIPVHVDAPWNHDSFANCAVVVELIFGRILSEGHAEVFERIKLLESHQMGMME
jgi:DNA-binding MurR/RpiR family transcriptional regulator